VRIDERRGEMEEAKSGAEREDQQECRTIVPRRRRADGAINFGGLYVLDPLRFSGQCRVSPCSSVA
jgi:hypothetical protein